MASGKPIASMLADMVLDTSHKSPWCSLEAATKGLSSPDLTYVPIPEMACDIGRDPWDPPWAIHERIVTPRRILYHILEGAEYYGDCLGPRTRRKVEAEWDACSRQGPFKTPKSIIAPTDVALRRMHARASRVTDDGLAEGSGAWGIDAPRLLLLIDGSILHTAWHLGQVVLLRAWRAAQRKHELTAPPAKAPRLPRYPGGRDWSDARVGSRTEACLRLLRASYDESLFHALRLVTKGLTRAELHWRPFPTVPMPRCPGLHTILVHLADCRIMYADWAFGTHALRGSEPIFGEQWWREGSVRKLLGLLDRAQDFLVEHVSQATDDDLLRVRTMHQGRKMAGWQSVVTMAQHDAWHAGQIAIIRDLYRALAPTAPAEEDST